MNRPPTLIGVLLAGMLAAPVPVQGSEWAFFKACGFVFDNHADIDGHIDTQRAPNITGYWIRKRQVAAIVDWKNIRGLACSSLFVLGTSYEIHVVGTASEVREKLK